MSVIAKRKARSRRLAPRPARKVGATRLVRLLSADRRAGCEAQRLVAASQPVYFMNKELSGHILRQRPDGVLEEVELTAEGTVHVLGTLAGVDNETAAAGSRRI